jgi:hypothetical protein
MVLLIDSYFELNSGLIRLADNTNSCIFSTHQFAAIFLSQTY